MRKLRLILQMNSDHLWYDKDVFFMKYFKEYFAPNSDRETIISIMGPIWGDMCPESKYDILTAFFIANSINAADGVYKLLDLAESLNCGLIQAAANNIYYRLTGRNYETNYFKCFEIESSLGK